MGKKKKWRYTEHTVEQKPSNAAGYAKLFLTFVVISPLRLVNEISQKALFLGRETLKKVCLHAIAINTGLLLWSLFWRYIKPNSNPFIPFAVNILSLLLLVGIFIKLKAWKDFDYQILENIEEEEEQIAIDFDPDSIRSFDNTPAADISFNDAMDIFIKDPEELTVANIHPARYSVHEDERMLKAIEQRTDLFEYEKIELPALFEEPPLGSQLEDNFNSLLEELEEQMKKA